MGSDQFVARKCSPPIALAARDKYDLALFISEPIERLLDGEIGAPPGLASARVREHHDWFGNFNGESIGHEQGPAHVLAEEFQPAEDVDVAPNGGEVEAVARAQIRANLRSTSMRAGFSSANTDGSRPDASAQGSPGG
jgi:hypothetical protein